MMTEKISLPDRTAGFTLVELMVTVLIGAILLGIAIPSYSSSVRKSRRTDARNAVLDLAAREERFFSTANSYTNDPASLGYNAFGAGTPIGSGYYYLLTPVIVTGDPTQIPPVLAGYTITATATGSQVKDTACASFTINQIGKQSSLDSGGADSTATCWGN